jgi:hypothetical protein
MDGAAVVTNFKAFFNTRKLPDMERINSTQGNVRAIEAQPHPNNSEN